jgi:hypothetical protein
LDEFHLNLFIHFGPKNRSISVNLSFMVVLRMLLSYPSDLSHIY